MIRRAQAQWESNQSDMEGAASETSHEPSPLRSSVPAAAALIAATTGDPQPRHLDHAIAVRRALPPSLRVDADAPEQARILILSLVTFADPAQRDQQLTFIAERLGQPVADAVQRAATTAVMLSPLLRLPAVLQLFPALRQLSADERLRLAQLLQHLTRMDGRISVFEYALEKLVTRGLAMQLRPRDPHGSRNLAACSYELGIVFAVLARHGARDQEQARYAYEAGLAPLLPRERPAYNIIESWVPVFDDALERLAELQVTAKQLLIEGLVRTIAHDELLAPEEAELLRAICAVLECPMPPVLPPATS
jgi:acyl dehydratase